MKYLCFVFILFSSAAWADPQPASPDPAAKFGSPCPYPDSALHAGIQGSTLVSYRGTSDGAIADVALLASSGNADLDAATVQCVGRWRFDPQSPAEAINIGPHRTYIKWSIPPTGTAAGRLAGLPHTCGNYPRAEWAQGIEGSTTLHFHIMVDGSVSDITVAQSSGNDHLDEAAVQCARHWSYRPALQNGAPVEVGWMATVTWRKLGPPPQ